MLAGNRNCRAPYPGIGVHIRSTKAKGEHSLDLHITNTMEKHRACNSCI